MKDYSWAYVSKDSKNTKYILSYCKKSTNQQINKIITKDMSSFSSSFYAHCRSSYIKQKLLPHVGVKGQG
jgi:hypothetical protein